LRCGLKGPVGQQVAGDADRLPRHAVTETGADRLVASLRRRQPHIFGDDVGFGLRCPRATENTFDGIDKGEACAGGRLDVVSLAELGPVVEHDDLAVPAPRRLGVDQRLGFAAGHLEIFGLGVFDIVVEAAFDAAPRPVVAAHHHVRDVRHATGAGVAVDPRLPVAAEHVRVVAVGEPRQIFADRLDAGGRQAVARDRIPAAGGDVRAELGVGRVHAGDHAQAAEAGLTALFAHLVERHFRFFSAAQFGEQDARLPHEEDRLVLDLEVRRMGEVVLDPER